VVPGIFGPIVMLLLFKVITFKIKGTISMLLLCNTTGNKEVFFLQTTENIPQHLLENFRYANTIKAIFNSEFM
jgi:hypothetical protein